MAANCAALARRIPLGQEVHGILDNFVRVLICVVALSTPSFLDMSHHLRIPKRTEP
jgi:hypothetical protein